MPADPTQLPVWTNRSKASNAAITSFLVQPAPSRIRSSISISELEHDEGAVNEIRIDQTLLTAIETDEMNQPF
jgi:hypothetical protein